MATGVLVVGVGRATKLLGYVAGDSKTYLATIRIGVGTDTEDREGTAVETPGTTLLLGSAEDLRRLSDAMASLTGDISQVPSAVSAIKVDGKRSYARVRAGEHVELKPRVVTVSRFVPTGKAREAVSEGVRVVDLDVEVDCSSGTYVRALARDLGAALGSAAHLTALRRTRVGDWTLDSALTLEQLEQVACDGGSPLIPLAQAAAEQFPVLLVTQGAQADFAHGKRLALPEALAEPSEALEGAGPSTIFALATPTAPGEPFGLAKVEGSKLVPVLHLFPGGH